MAGHSKWANIQHRKKAQDAKRGKLFTRLIREITVAARMGGADPESNPRLRAAMDKGFGANMTKDTIERAVKRGAGGLEGANVEEICYEGYGPGGVAVLVECFTDNRNRTVGEVRHAFSKCGGNLGTEGSVAYLFDKTGILSFSADNDADKIMDVAIESGANDVTVHDDQSVDVTTTPENFISVKEAMEQAKLIPLHAEIMQVAKTEVTLDKEQAEKMLRLIDMLEELDDVQDVHSNADISQEIMEELQ
jgi:YebC/PmpR family DNA-binding regulatory protein